MSILGVKKSLDLRRTKRKTMDIWGQAGKGRAVVNVYLCKASGTLP